VYELCRALAEVLNLGLSDQRTLEVSAWLHDIGLVGLPRQLIKRWENSPGSLSDAERALIEQHSVVGQELAEFAPPLRDVGRIIRGHHERFDGRGYPDGLAGEHIPWLARLLAVAVAYAESPLDGPATLGQIKEGRGKAFDPEAVRALVRCLPQATVPRRQREVLLSELQPGMVLARGIYTATGLLLIPDGQRLTATFISKLNHHNRVDPITQSLLVYS
jgi:response regulator RpfG family c-di-GMP phosphodiesterase